MMKIGYIGAGNMAQAMIGGMINSGFSQADIFASAKTDATLDKVRNLFGIDVTKDSTLIVKECDIIIVAVKPYMYGEILAQINPYLNPEKIIVTIAAGITIADVESMIGTDKKIIRTMPNTPALVNEGMSALCVNGNIEAGDLEKVTAIFESFGKCEVVAEHLIDVVIGVSGSAPAYAFMFIEAMADCAVSYGMTRKMAYDFAAQTLLGASKMVLETQIHPGQLKDMVCSPGGTTIEAVKTLEAEGFRNAVIKGMSAAIEKSKMMSK